MDLRAEFDRVVAAYRDKVFRLALSYLRDRAEAEDAAQDAFLKLWQALPAFDGRAQMSTLLYTITRNTCLTRLRDRKPTCPVPERASPSQVSHEWDMTRLMQRLSDDQRQVLELFYWEENSVMEVAAMLAMPEGTVKSLLHRARKNLAETMKEVGWTAIR